MKKLFLLTLIHLGCRASVGGQSDCDSAHPVHMRGYYRKNGTCVQPRYRARPGCGTASPSAYGFGAQARPASNPWPKAQEEKKREEEECQQKRYRSGYDSGLPVPAASGFSRLEADAPRGW